MRHVLAVFATLALATSHVAQPAPISSLPAQPTETNIVYGSYSGLALLMDRYVPSRPNGLAILHISGSGFQAPISMEPSAIKDSPQSRKAIAPFLERGFTVFTINHRAAPRFTHPAPFEDAQRAARFIRSNAKAYGVSADWLGLLGASSGGNLVLMLATLGESEKGPSTTPVAPPQCVIAVMPPTDLLPLGQDGIGVALTTQHVGVVAPFPEEAGLPGYAERLARYQQASPLHHLASGNRSRFLLIHGDADPLVPISQSQSFVARAEAVGVEAQLLAMPGTGHQFPSPFPTEAARWMENCAKETATAE